MSEPASAGKRRSALIDVARGLSSALNPGDLIDNILDRSREVMDCEVCSILLPEGPGGDLLIRSTLDPINAEPILVPKGRGIAGEVFATRQVVNIRDARDDPRHFTPAEDKSGLVSRAMLTIPLLDGDRCVGVMQAINPNHETSFLQADEEIFETFGSLIAVTLLRLEAQKQAIREAESHHELSVAKEIQMSFLPPANVRVGDISVDAFYEPASEIGGDFYFWHELDGGKILLGIGDVSGKGLAASLDMARGTTVISVIAHRAAGLGLAGWVGEFNARLCDVMSAGRFIAIGALLIDPVRRRLEVCCAGVPVPMVWDGRQWREVGAPGNPPPGISCRVSYQTADLPLALGRHWLLFSDGLLEIQDRAGRRFEDGAFDAALARLDPAAGRPVLAQLLDDWRPFAADPRYQDDTTIVTVTDATEPPPSRFAFRCEPGTLRLAREFIERWVGFCGFADEPAGLVVLGCDEVFTNLCKHAFCATGSGANASCAAAVENGALTIRIEHQGTGISNEEFERLVMPPSPTRVGGLGLHVIREVFDRVEFRKEPEKSTIELARDLR